MKKFLLILLLLIVLVVGGLVTMVMMSFNSTAYERQVVSTLQKLTGREVFVDGNTEITWNPMPTVTMGRVRLLNIEKATDPDMLTVEKIKVSMAWASLLKSPLEIKSIELTRPILSLERLESNRANFAFPFLLDPNFQLQEVDLLGDGAQSTAKIDSITIKDGQIRYINQITNTSVEVMDINGQLSVDSVQGPFRFKGTGNASGGQYILDATTGVFQGSAPISLVFQLSETTTKSNMDISGQLTPVSTEKWFEGSGPFNIDKFKEFMALLQIDIPDMPQARSAGGSLAIEIAPTRDSLKDFVIQLGSGEQKTAFTGTITRIISGKKPSYTIALGSDLIQLKDWKVCLDKLNWSWLSEDQYPDITFKTMIKSVQTDGDSLRDLNVSGEYQQGILTLQKSSVVLPGEATLTFNGSGHLIGDVPTLEIGMKLDAPSVQGVMKWLMPANLHTETPVLAQKGGFTGRVEMTPERLTTSIAEMKIGDTVINGLVQRNGTDKSSYMVKLNLNNINLDTYTGWEPPKEAVALNRLPGMIKQSLEQAKWANDISVQGTVDVNDGTVFGLPVSRLHIEGSLLNNVLSIKRLTAQNLATANMTLSATLNGIGRPQMNVDGLQLSLETKQLPLLLERTKLVSNLPLIQKATNTSFKFGLKGGRDGSWEVDTTAALTDSNIKLAGVVESLETNPTLKDFMVEVAHPNFQTFMKLIQPDFDLLPKLDGSFKAVGRISGTKDHFELSDAIVGVGLQQLSGSVAFDNRQIKTVTVQIASPFVDMERFLSDTDMIYTPMNGFSGKALNLDALDQWNLNIQLNAAQLKYRDINIRQADVALLMQNKLLKLMKLAGHNGNSDQSPIMMTGQLDWNTTPTLTANFNIKNIPLRPDFMVLSDFAFGGGMLSLTGELKARGESPMDFVRDLNGQGSISIRGGQMIGTDIEKMIPIITRAIQRNEGGKAIEPDFKRVLNSGKTVLQSISGEYVIANGIVRMMDLTMDTANTMANPMQVVWDMPKQTLDISIPVILKPLNMLPPFILGISASIGRGSYQPNYADLLAALSNQSQAALAKDLQQREEAARIAVQQKRSDRLNESKQLTAEARQAVALMEQKMNEFPFEKGARLLQSAKDAMALVTQLAVLEEPTDAQLIKQIEQARLVIIRADEFQQTLEQETIFNAQKQMSVYQERGQKMTEQLKSWSEGYPDIAILNRLFNTATQNQAIIEAKNAQLSADLSTEQMNALLSEASAAMDKIEQAYQHARRFDLSAVPEIAIPAAVAKPIAVSSQPVEDVSVQPSSKSVRGSFKRSK